MSDVIDRACEAVSTHSRLKAAGEIPPLPQRPAVGFNTQPPEGGWHHAVRYGAYCQFQHTAA